MRLGREHRRTGSTSSPRWAIFEHQFDLVRRADQTVYLRRWWIAKTPWFGIALHRMDAEDARPELHDHPFGFLSIVLRGGYIERRLDPRTMIVDETHRVRRLNRVRPHDAHSIRRLLRVPTWTLLLVGPYRRTWGFLEPQLRYSESDAVNWWTGWWWVPHDKFDSGHDAVAAEHAGIEDVRRCRVCGCTDDDCSGCIERTGVPCSWVDVDLCSACYQPRIERVGQTSPPSMNVEVVISESDQPCYELALQPASTRGNRYDLIVERAGRVEVLTGEVQLDPYARPVEPDVPAGARVASRIYVPMLCLTIPNACIDRSVGTIGDLVERLDSDDGPLAW